MRYLNAVEAARALGIGDKTIRRWLKSGKFPSAHIRPNGEYAIPENEINLLKQERDRYPSGGHDQSYSLIAKMMDLEQTIAQQERRIADLEQTIANLGRAVPSESASVAKNKPVTEQTTTTRREKPETANVGAKNTTLPDGCMLASAFAKEHGVSSSTFREHMLFGIGPGLIHGPDVPEDGSVTIKDYVRCEERNKRVRKDGTIEKERYLTSDQQAAALDFWRRHGVSFVQCDRPECQCKK